MDMTNWRILDRYRAGNIPLGLFIICVISIGDIAVRSSLSSQYEHEHRTNVLSMACVNTGGARGGSFVAWCIFGTISSAYASAWVSFGRSHLFLWVTLLIVATRVHRISSWIGRCYDRTLPINFYEGICFIPTIYQYVSFISASWRTLIQPYLFVSSCTMLRL